MIQKLKMEQTPLAEAVAKIKDICPSAVTNDGKVDFEYLKTFFGTEIAEESFEKYEFTWVGKNAAKAEANRPIRKTLRPVVEDSKNWDTTQNLYIEGDNLNALKLLQESYLGKIKVIYIDPPYNTGNDFVYCDEFSVGCEEYLDKKGQCDTDGNRLFVNTETNGRFHSDWCSMMYSRLKLARDLLSDDGIIFVSIDDHEFAALRKICDEIFGEDNFESSIKYRRRSNQPNDATKMIATVSEYCLVYAKNSNVLKFKKSFGTVPLSEERLSSYTNPDNDPKGAWSSTPWCASKGQGGSRYVITTPTGVQYDEVWLGTKDTFEKHLAEGRIVFTSNGSGKPRKKIYKTEAIARGQAAIDFWVGEDVGDNLTATSELKQLFGLDRIFDYSKPLKYIKTMLKIAAPNANDVILDFFSGSATTAHAVMQLNAEDGGHRKFIMVQLPENCDDKSEAFKAGYKNICEIGKERIRRAGDKIIAETGKTDLDIGFRVLKVDSTNMKDIYYKPSDTTQSNLLEAVDNIKNDRSDLDLLFGVMVDCGLALLDRPIETKTLDGKKYYVVDGNYLVACFEPEITEKLVYEIANMKPTCAVFRDSSFADAKDKINVSEIFKNVTGSDECVKVL